MKKLLLLSALTLAGGMPDTASAQEHYVHTFERIPLSETFYAEGGTFGDFNRDGVMDVAAGPYWYAGPDYQARHTYYEPKAFDPEGYSDNFFAHPYDFNDDGWQDIFIIGFPGQDASWYENPKGAAGHWKRHVVFDQVDNESPHWTDLTGDGRPEIVAHSKGYLGYAEADWSDPARPWTFHPITKEGPWGNFTHGYGVGDVNGDGRQDVLLKEGWWEQPASRAGDPVWTHHPADFGPGGAQMYAYDVDGDGDNDVITSLEAHGYGLAWYEQTGTGGDIRFTRHLIMGETPEDNRYGVKFSQVHAVDLVDMDGDGIKDIVAGKRAWAHGYAGDPEPNAPAVIYWFRTVRGDDGSVDFVPYLISDDTGVGVQVVLGDANGDGLPDVVSSNKKGASVLIHSKRAVGEAEWERAQPEVYGAGGRR